MCLEIESKLEHSFVRVVWDTSWNTVWNQHLNSKPKHKTKKKADQKADAINVLKQNGIEDAEKVLDEILTARKGSPTEHTKLKFKKYKNDY